MTIQMRIYNPMFFLPLAMAIAGILTINPLAIAETNPKNDVQSTVVPGQMAPRLQNLGFHKFSVTTSSKRAQLFINQGLMLTYGFNHAEASRSFREAARLDPNCAMAYWGMALVLGPNINLAMPPENEPKAYEMIQKAMALKKGASEREQAYIEALATRYSGEAKSNRTALDRVYAEAMRQLHEHYPDDLDVATLYAEALMDLRPWNYWTRDMQPYPETKVIHHVLESVLGAFDIMQAAAVADRMASRAPDIYVRPELPDVRMLDFGRAEDVLRQAGPAAEKLRAELAKRGFGRSTRSER